MFPTNTLLLLSLTAIQASNYILPASIIGCYNPREDLICSIPPFTETKPVNYIEPSIMASQIIRHPRTDMSYIYVLIMGFIIITTIVLSLDFKKTRKRIFAIDQYNVYYQPLPPIQEGDEEEELEDPVHFQYINPIIPVQCEDPC